MIIVNVSGGLGNQFFQYAAGLRLAKKWKTELKVKLDWYDKNKDWPWLLPLYNIHESIATKEEYEWLAEHAPNSALGREMNTQIFMPEVLDYPDNVCLRGCWESERYFPDISNELRKQFTLRQPLGAAARYWQEKILAAECSVSIHVRHGDFVYNPRMNKYTLFAVLPIDYYRECLNILRRQHKNLTLFIFSNNLHWCKENLHFDMPTEYVAGEGIRDFEELHLMSRCKHNIIANSTFSWWGAWLNQNPNKQVFVPIPSAFIGTDNLYRHFSVKRNKNSPLQSDRWIRVPFDQDNQPIVNIRPYFSLLLIVNDDIATIEETLATVISQDYRFYEIIIIDNASTDGSGKICRQIAREHDNVTLIKLWDRISIYAAWNKALDLAQGKFVMFLRGNDRIFAEALSSIYLTNEFGMVDVVSSVNWLSEDENGALEVAGRKFGVMKDKAFENLEGSARTQFNKSTLLKILATNEGSTPLATKIFNRKFLLNNSIRFNEKIGDEAQRLFNIDTMLLAEENTFSPNIFYITPGQNLFLKK